MNNFFIIAEAVFACSVFVNDVQFPDEQIHFHENCFETFNEHKFLLFWVATEKRLLKLQRRTHFFLVVKENLMKFYSTLNCTSSKLA
jgi:hypothetical protein